MKPARLATLAGFSLLELLIALLLLTIISSLAVVSYRNHLLQARLAEARAALLENNHFMQRWYAEHGTFQGSSPASWPSLPVQETADFTIAFNSQAPSLDNIENASFLINALPKPAKGWPAQLRLILDQDGNIRQCDQPKNSSVEICEVQ
ncbi:type IV pilin protein [Neisseriaceae bacterium TC5R-5]|nr:type IV pilin protein [Neisseriaceae bacterium TC5R-5]